MIIHDLPEKEYHARTELSSTQARELLKAPAIYKHNLTATRHSTATFDFGSAVHSMVLGVGWGIKELDYPDWRTAAAKQARADAEIDGLIPLLTKDIQPIRECAETVLAHPEARALLEAASWRETTIITDTPEGVPIRARLDALTPDGHGIDLKTSLDAYLSGFNRSVATYGYHVQAGHYSHAWEHSEGSRMEQFTFLVVEKTAPYLVNIIHVPEHLLQMGQADATLARQTLAECAANDTWPGYTTGEYLTPPAWLIYEHEDRHGINNDADNIRI